MPEPTTALRIQRQTSEMADSTRASASQGSRAQGAVRGALVGHDFEVQAQKLAPVQRRVGKSVQLSQEMNMDGVVLGAQRDRHGHAHSHVRGRTGGHDHVRDVPSPAGGTQAPEAGPGPGANQSEAPPEATPGQGPQVYDESNPRPIDQESPAARRARAEMEYQRKIGRANEALAVLDPAARAWAMGEIEQMHAAILAAAERGERYNGGIGAHTESGGILGSGGSSQPRMQRLGGRGERFWTGSGERGAVVFMDYSDIDGRYEVHISPVFMEQNVMVVSLGRYNYQTQRRETAADTRLESTDLPGSLAALAGRPPPAAPQPNQAEAPATAPQANQAEAPPAAPAETNETVLMNIGNELGQIINELANASQSMADPEGVAHLAAALSRLASGVRRAGASMRTVSDRSRAYRRLMDYFRFAADCIDDCKSAVTVVLYDVMRFPSHRPDAAALAQAVGASLDVENAACDTADGRRGIILANAMLGPSAQLHHELVSLLRL